LFNKPASEVGLLNIYVKSTIPAYCCWTLP
jgi:hypothetical protein